MGLAKPRIQLAAAIFSILLSGTGSNGVVAGPIRPSYPHEPIKRFATIPIDSIAWCDAKAEEVRRRAPGAEVSKAFASYEESQVVTGYWIDTDDGATIGLACLGKTAVVIGQKNLAHWKRGQFMGTVERYGPQCRILERQELFLQDRGMTVFWTNRDGDDDVVICMPGTGSISLSRVRE
jgi:hypothetical protein